MTGNTDTLLTEIKNLDSPCGVAHSDGPCGTMMGHVVWPVIVISSAALAVAVMTMMGRVLSPVIVISSAALALAVMTMMGRVTQ